MVHLAVLGSTGSIGSQALEVIKTLPHINVAALTGGDNVNLLRSQIQEFSPTKVVVKEEIQRKHLQQEFPDLEVLGGEEGLRVLACDDSIDCLLVALVGYVGLHPTLCALEKGKRVLLANKETLVIGGHLVMKYGDYLVPIDSEHSALWQLLLNKEKEEVKNLILTASGGPFFSSSIDLEHVTVEQALKHPNWTMGKKITIDSATMMNKGLEVIEAYHLFGFDFDQIQVVIHRESLIHALVEMVDGSHYLLASGTDMRLPIQTALTSPKTYPSLVPPLDLTKIPPLTFAACDRERFPCLDLAYHAGRIGGSMPTVLNAANEAAVALFLGGEIGFMDIPRMIASQMEKHKVVPNPDLETVLALHKTVYEKTRQDKKKG